MPDLNDPRVKAVINGTLSVDELEEQLKEENELSVSAGDTTQKVKIIDAIDDDKLVADLLSKGYITQKFEIGKDVYEIKTLTNLEFSVFTRLFNHKISSKIGTSSLTQMLSEQIRTECMLIFIIKSINGEEFSPIDNDFIQAWRSLERTGTCVYKDTRYNNHASFFDALYNDYLMDKLMSLPTIVVDLIVEVYNQLLEKITKVVKGGGLKKV